MNAVLLIAFNRPRETAEVIKAVRAAGISRLYVAMDGPRQNNENDEKKCQEVRALFSKTDGRCEIRTLFSKENVGCRRAVSSAINWFFEHEEQGIILEDDCVPTESFFGYCDQLLETYKDDTRVMAISGDNFQKNDVGDGFGTYFSRYPHCWGWATWRRAWRHYDAEMQFWPKVRGTKFLYNILQSTSAARYWEDNFNRVYDKEIDSWAIAWTFSCWFRGGLTILPRVNLVNNIGVGTQATHRISIISPHRSTFEGTLELPVKVPPYVVRNFEADEYTEKKLYSAQLWKRMARKVRDGFFK